MQNNKPNLTPEQAKQAWDSLCTVYRTLGQHGGSIDPNHALLLVEKQTGIPVAPSLEQ